MYCCASRSSIFSTLFVLFLTLWQYRIITRQYKRINLWQINIFPGYLYEMIYNHPTLAQAISNQVRSSSPSKGLNVANTPAW